jgi:nicotinic acid mononucleotide adenylyltransferase
LKHHFDEVWIVPCGDRVDKHSLSLATHRLEMCRLMFFEDKVLDLEVENGTIVPSYLLMQRLSASNPDKLLCFVIGSDNVPTLHKWRFADQLINEVQFVVVSRGGYVVPDEFRAKPNFMTIEVYEERHESSTSIRAHIANFTGPWDEAAFRVHMQDMKPEILEYIIAHELYALRELKSSISSE